MKMKSMLTIYRLFQQYRINPRFALNNFHEKHSHYSSLNATRNLVSRAFKQEIILKPELYCNCGISIFLYNDDRNPLKELKKLKKDPSVTYAMALCGGYSLLVLRKGASELSFASRVPPTFPSEKKLEELYFDEKGTLPIDKYPHGWDEIDWEVYYLMKNPTISYTDAARNSQLARQTIKRHYKKILQDCKIQVSFLPHGYRWYDKLLLQFKTKYEIGLQKALKELDRTSNLWKFKDFIILYLFVDDSNETANRFEHLEEVGLIEKLKVSIPIRYHAPQSD
ncbi:MAG: hypothetical protein PVF58_22045 [Candidatus Methanofastidiosia archaeon]